MYPSPARGPRGRELSTDVAWFGDRRAPKVGILVSATHGVEGYCGSAAQLDGLAERGYERLKSDEAMLLIHALNPYGFAWDRRVTQEGCDLNRNFVDFTAPLPHNSAYDLLADCFVPCELDGPLFVAAEATIEEFCRTHGEIDLRKARTSGQYRHPTGIFFRRVCPCRRTANARTDRIGLLLELSSACLDHRLSHGPRALRLW
ncbi:DUF2817 domain-containing protein [Bradyrhizobium sp. GM2.2]|uniref:DUF2817 domain-containing protein n=1 Tax=Bradyrhizobium sp. GM2.2 TaxID=3156358 RepID=UPI003399E787